MMEAAIHVKPFGFDRVFHFSGGEEPAKVTEEPPQLLDQVEALQERIAAIEEAHRVELGRARADGFAAGLDQARRDREAAVLAAADAIHAAIEQIDLRLDWAIEAMTTDAAAAALAAAEALAGHAIDHVPARAIDEALDRVLRQVARGTALTVKVHPDLVDVIEQQALARANRDRRKLAISVIADAATPPGDAEILWEEGGLTVSMAARRAAVLAEIGPLLKDAAAQ